MIVNYFNILSFVLYPFKTNAPLVTVTFPELGGFWLYIKVLPVITSDEGEKKAGILPMEEFIS
jgi:hypothetical protein